MVEHALHLTGTGNSSNIKGMVNSSTQKISNVIYNDFCDMYFSRKDYHYTRTLCIIQYGDDAGNTAAENPTVFCLVKICSMPSAKACMWVVKLC